MNKNNLAIVCCQSPSISISLAYRGYLHSQYYLNWNKFKTSNIFISHYFLLFPIIWLPKLLAEGSYLPQHFHKPNKPSNPARTITQVVHWKVPQQNLPLGNPLQAKTKWELRNSPYLLSSWFDTTGWEAMNQPSSILLVIHLLLRFEELWIVWQNICQKATGIGSQEK